MCVYIYTYITMCNCDQLWLIAGNDQWCMIVWCTCIPVWIRGEDLDTLLPSHKTLGPNLSLYKEFSPIKTWSLQETSANSRQNAKHWAESALQEGCPTLMANLKEPSIIQLYFSPYPFCRRFCALRRLGPFEPWTFCREKRFQCTSPFLS